MRLFNKNGIKQNRETHSLNVEKLLLELLCETEYELFQYPFTTKKEDLKYFIKRMLRPIGTPKRDSFFWTHAMLAMALESAGEIEVLKKYYDLWIDKGIPIYHLDNVMNGYSLLYVYEQTKEKKYEEAANRLYAYVHDYKKDMTGTLPYRKHHSNHMYVDAIGMIVPFLCRYGRVFNHKEAFTIGIDYLIDFIKYGMDEKTGLPYHGYDFITKTKYGIIGWGRAVGWLMLGLADSLEFLLDHHIKDKLYIELKRLINVCIEYQRADGYFAWQLTAMDGPKDTSATAMIGYAIQKMMQYESIYEKQNAKKDTRTKDITYEDVIASIKSALISSCKNGKIYDCSGECEGFSQYPQVYGAYPWSLGPGVRFLIGLDKI